MSQFSHPALNKQYLTEQYINLQKSCRDIGKDLGVTHNTVARALKYFGIPIAPKKSPKGEKKNTRTMGRAFKYLINEVLTKQVLEELYIQKNQTALQISQILSCKESSVANALDFHGIKMRDAGYKPGHIPPHKGKTAETSEHAANISKGKEGKPNYKNRGPNNYKWKGGPNDEEIAARMTLEYTLWKRAVYKRDNYTCQCCGRVFTGKDRKYVCAHHIKYFDTHPHLRYEVSNGVVLCRKCHTREHRDDNMWTKEFIKSRVDIEVCEYEKEL